MTARSTSWSAAPKGGCDDGGGLWQAHGPARHLLRHPRPRRHQCQPRRPHRDAGFDADDPVRRPGRTGMREREAFQELDYKAVFGTMAKWVVEIDDAGAHPGDWSRAPSASPCRAVRGPVVISLPEDMLTETAAVADAPRSSRRRPGRRMPISSALRAMLAQREAPLVILGGSRWTEARRASIARFAERFDLPVATSFRRAVADRRRSFATMPAISASGRTRACRAHQGADRHSAHRRPHVGNAVLLLHAARHPDSAAEAVHVHPARKSSAASISRRSRSRRRPPPSQPPSRR